MARKAPAAPPPPAAPYRVAGPDFKGLALLLLSLVTVLALLGVGPGRLNQTAAHALRWAVGWGALPLALGVGALGALVLLRVPLRARLSSGRVLAAECLALCLLGLATLWANPALAWGAATQGSGGGTVGWLIATLLSPIGAGGAAALLVVVALLLLLPLAGMTLERLQETLDRQRHTLERQKARLQTPAEPKPFVAPSRVLPKPASPAASQPSSAIPSESRAAPAKAAPEPKAANPAPVMDRLKTMVETLQGSATSAVGGRAPAKEPPKTVSVGRARPRPAFALPPLDMLHRATGGGLDPNVAREKARVIEETLRQFGVPATVVQVNQGPAVTQFGVQPGFLEVTRRDGTVEKRKVKVNAITSLADDLALALAAKSIRVEAPVPGRPYVGIEVPNSDTEMVTLHSVLTSDEFRRIGSDLAFALGRDVSGHPIAGDLARMPHLLIAGATGSGKSVCVNTIIASLLFNLGPDRLKMLMIDPKMVELIPYNGIPHLIAPVVTDMDRVVGALTWAMREMDRRYKLFSEAGKRNFESYNQWAEANGQEPLPYIVILIDELADLMMVAADQVERIICRIAQMARATGMHLILATQRPSVDVVTGLIKANVPARIAFAVASQIDSRVILDSIGAEALLGRGDMLFQAPDSPKLQRLQGCFVSDAELSAIVTHWLRHPTPATAAPPADGTPWDEIVDELAEPAESAADDLLEQAIALVREHQWASTSFLQRKLRIGYTRAARLIDALEERGIIGPPEDGTNGSRTVLAGAGEETNRVESS